VTSSHPRISCHNDSISRSQVGKFYLGTGVGQAVSRVASVVLRIPVLVGIGGKRKTSNSGTERCRTTVLTLRITLSQ